MFSGNRLPGVVGTIAAFNRAERYGVWIGRRALLATGNGVSYRLATRAKSAGIDIARIADTRLDPQSRFVQFGKAYGIPMAFGLRLRQVEAAARGGGLTAHLDHDPGEIAREADRFELDQLVVSGGWQPDLTLWHMAGGASRWDAAAGRLEAEGRLSGIVLAGSVAGYRNTAACLKSGQAAVAELYGRPVPDIDDTQIEAMFESADAPTAIGEFDAKHGPCPSRRRQRPRAAPGAPQRRRLSFGLGGQTENWGIADEARPLGVADVAAAVQLGVIPPGEAAIVAQGRSRRGR